MGGLNVSVLDGWWAEAFFSDAGWALGVRKQGNLNLDEAAEELYDCLEQEVIPAFYHCNEERIPADWVARMRQSMAQLTPHFSANRAVREYTTRYYLPAAKRFHERTAEDYAEGRRLSTWKNTMQTLWQGVRFGARRVQKVGERYLFEVSIDLNGLATEQVCVELYRQAGLEGMIVREVMQLVAVDVEYKTVFLYRAGVAANCLQSDYTARAFPQEPLLELPLESGEILWQERSEHGA